MEEEYRYQGKRELKKKYLVSLFPSVHDGVKKLLDKHGGNFSTLIGNLLTTWAYNLEIEDIGEKKWKEKYGFEEWNKKRDKWAKSENEIMRANWKKKKLKEVEGKK